MDYPGANRKYEKNSVKAKLETLNSFYFTVRISIEKEMSMKNN
jgi:hypothetical protein